MNQEETIPEIVTEIPEDLALVVRQENLGEVRTQRLMNDFAPFHEQIEQIKKSSTAITDGADPLQREMARACRLKLRSTRSDIERVRKENKASALREGKAVDGLANILKFLCEPEEERLEAVEKFEERRLAAEAAERLRIRTAQLTEAEDDPTKYNLDVMTEEMFASVLATAKREKQHRADEAARIEAERIEAARKAEEERKAKEAAEAAERKRITEENERLRKEAEVAKAKAAADAEAAAKREATLKAKAAAEAKVAAEAKAKAEAKAAAEAKAKAEAEAEVVRLKQEAEALANKTKAEALAKAEAERQRVLAEARAKTAEFAAKTEAVAEAMRMEAQAPDIQKLQKFALNLLAVNVAGSLTSAAGKQILHAAYARRSNLVEYIEQEIVKLQR